MQGYTTLMHKSISLPVDKPSDLLRVNLVNYAFWTKFEPSVIP